MNSTAFTRFLAPLRGALVCALALVSMASMAQSITAGRTYFATNCASCHSAPPTLVVPHPAGGFSLDLSASWMNTAAGDPTPVPSFQARLNTLRANATQMATLADNPSPFTNLRDVHAYLVAVRDGEVGTATPSFPATAVGSSNSASFSFSIVNYRADAMGYTLSVAGTNAADFSISSHTVTGGCSVGSVNGSSGAPVSCQVNLTVSFTPAAAGNPRSADLRVNLSTSSQPQPPNQPRQVATLSGVSFVPTPVFSASASSLGFGARLGQSTTQDLTICNGSYSGGACNVGTATANLALSGFAFSRSEYARDAASSCSTSTSLIPGSSCVLRVAFTPAAAGAANGSVQIAHNATGGSSTITLNGTGTQSLIGSSASSLAFGDVQIGFSSARSVTISNSGSAPLNFTSDPRAAARITGSNSADFSITGGTCQQSTALAASGGICTLNLAFTPAAGAAVSRSATLTLPSDATNGPLVIDLGGTASSLPPPEFSATALTFPDTVVGEANATLREFTITNRRTGPITYNISSTADFLVVEDGSTCAARAIPPNGGVCTVRLRFSPQTAGGPGLRSANLPVTFTVGTGEPPATAGNVSVSGTAVLPVALSTTTLSPSAVVGAPVTSSLVLSNRSAAAITLSSIAFGGAAASDYSLDVSSGCVAGGSVPAGGNCTLVVRFNPAAAGTRTASMSIAHSGFGSPQTVSLQGSAMPAPQGRLELSATSLTYPDTQLGSTASQTLTLRNAGDLALRLNTLSIGGAHAGDFERAGTCSTTAPVGIGQTCTIDVNFRPSALGARTGALTIEHDGSNPSATVALAGTGIPVPVPVVSFAPASVAFGAQTVGGLYPARVLRLSNTGTAALTVGSITVEGSTFALVTASPCPASLAPGEGCDISVRFTPAAAGASYTGAVRVASNAAGSPQSAALSGSGTAATVPVLAWTPAVTQLDFGQVSAGTVSATQSVSVGNQGPGGATISLVNTVGADAAVFAVGGSSADPSACQPGRVLFEGESCRVDVRFAPAGSGARTATLQVASTGAGLAPLTLVGTGLGGPAPALGLSAEVLTMGVARIGASSAPVELVLQSNGAGPLRVLGMTVSGPFAMTAKTCPAAPFTLAAGTSCAVSVSFVPTSAGAATGALEVASDASTTPARVLLSATGEPAPEVSSGGCSIASGDAATDPTLWILLILAWAALLWRRRRGAVR
jgi:trimeric autotransporter adhesin